MQYKKLIRDNIRKIIKSTGKEFSMCMLSEEEYRIEEKNYEELEEYYNASKKRR